MAEAEIIRQYGVKVIGRIDEVKERYYAISIEKKVKHPAVVAIMQTARAELFQAAAAS